MKIGKKEKNIPIPKKKSGPTGIYKTIFDKLEVGESQLIEDVSFGSLENAIWKYNRSQGKLIVAFQMKKAGHNRGDKRIWRLA